MALAVAFVGFFYRDLLRRRLVAAALVIGGLTALVFLEILGGNVVQRFERRDLSIQAALKPTARR